jgi:hypothetical protein
MVTLVTIAVLATACDAAPGGGPDRHNPDRAVLATGSPIVRPSVPPPGGGPRIGFVPGEYRQAAPLAAPGPSKGTGYDLGEPAQRRVLDLAAALGLGDIPVEFGSSPWTVRRGETALQVWPETGGRWQYQRDAVTPTAARRPAPSAQQATTVAAPVLRAAGLDLSTATVRRSDYTTQLTLDPTLGGIPTWGWQTEIQVDAAGISYAVGWLSDPTPTHPLDLLDANHAFHQMKAQAAARASSAHPRCLAATTQAWTPPCARLAVGVTVTAARYTLALDWDPRPRLRPAWLFTTSGGEQIAYPAARER